MNSLGALFSRFSKGSLKISGEALPVAIELGLEIDKKNTNTSLSDMNRACSYLLSKIELEKPVYLFFDELELFHVSDEQFDRDRRILRDLIYAISHINAESSELGRRVFLCTSVRSEVLLSVLQLGHEISRDIDDYGIKLDWSESKVSETHPLLRLIGKKMSVSIGVDQDLVWKKLFPEKINNQLFYRFILNSTYFRPRDLVRLLRVARDYRDTDTKFTDEHFNQTSLEYSRQTWVEVTEELLAIYSAEEVHGMERLFLGFRTHFFKNELEERMCTRYRNDRIISELKRRHGLDKVLADLYRIGVIGNDFWASKKSRNRWIFRGNANLNDSERMAFHKSLWKHLSLVETPKRVSKNSIVGSQ